MQSDKRTQNSNIPNPVREALQEVLDYLWDDELSDFRATDNTDGHVFQSLVVVHSWLHGESKTASDYLLPS